MYACICGCVFLLGRWHLDLNLGGGGCALSSSLHVVRSSNSFVDEVPDASARAMKRRKKPPPHSPRGRRRRRRRRRRASSGRCAGVTSHRAENSPNRSASVARFTSIHSRSLQPLPSPSLSLSLDRDHYHRRPILNPPAALSWRMVGARARHHYL